MVDDSDWAAINDSEIFRIYVANELRKEAELKANAGYLAAEELERKVEAEHEAYDQLEKFEAEVRGNPVKLAYFRKVRRALMTVPGLIEKTDKKFVDGIMMLDLGE